MERMDTVTIITRTQYFKWSTKLVMWRQIQSTYTMAFCQTLINRKGGCLILVFWSIKKCPNNAKVYKKE